MKIFLFWHFEPHLAKKCPWSWQHWIWTPINAASFYPYSQFFAFKGEWSIWGSARAACAKNACGKLHYPTVGGAVCIILYRGPFVNNTGPSVKFMYTAPPSGVTSSGSCRNSDCRNFNFVYFFIWSLTLKGEKLRIGIKTGWNLLSRWIWFILEGGVTRNLGHFWLFWETWKFGRN